MTSVNTAAGSTLGLDLADSETTVSCFATVRGKEALLIESDVSIDGSKRLVIIPAEDKISLG